MNVGLIGLGRMGTAIAHRLAGSGCEVVAWDHERGAMARARQAGIRVSAHPCELAARSEMVLSIITEDHGVRRLFLGPDGLLEGDVSGKLFIEMSTLQPMTVQGLAPEVEAKGARLIDAPVLGSIPTVREGKLLALAGGRKEDVERAGLVLGHLTRRVVHMGPIGSGHAMKLAVNLGLGSYIQALSESLALGRRQGLALDQMLEVLQEAPYASGWLASKVAVLRGAEPETTLDIQTLRKDLLSAVATGALSGVPMPVSAAVAAALSAAVAGGAGSRDLGELPSFVHEKLVQTPP